ncbi:MAG: hypothetical protein ACR652_02965 [Methylocystis sp.]|uniref:hypothetical protein n=1 Tax=Methylocystis sp. TaxID=1911079 RepID=UPI003DA31A94
MQKQLMGMCFLIFLPLFAKEAKAQLFYEDCAQGKCRKAFIEKKEKIGDELYFVQTIYLTYHQLGTTNAEEQNRSAKISCNMVKPTVTWGRAGKAQIVNKSIFAKPVLKKGKLAEPQKQAKYDDTTSLWKKICPMH